MYFSVLKRGICKRWKDSSINLKSDESIQIIAKATIEVNREKVKNIWKEMIWELTKTIDGIHEYFSNPYKTYSE